MMIIIIKKNRNNNSLLKESIGTPVPTSTKTVPNIKSDNLLINKALWLEPGYLSSARRGYGLDGRGIGVQLLVGAIFSPHHPDRL
jgi:hypothetical protein